MPSIGLIDESDYDTEALSSLIRRLNPQGVEIHSLPCNGHVRGRFFKRLNILKYVPVTRAVVVSDANGGDHEQLIHRLRREINHQVFPFQVEFVVLVREMEALLLADPRAIERVCAERGNSTQVPDLRRSPELLPDPKAELQIILGRAGIQYTKIVAGQIAEYADLGRLEYWCASYRRLRDAVTFPQV